MVVDHLIRSSARYVDADLAHNEGIVSTIVFNLYCLLRFTISSNRRTSIHCVRYLLFDGNGIVSFRIDCLRSHTDIDCNVMAPSGRRKCLAHKAQPDLDLLRTLQNLMKQQTDVRKHM